MAWYDGLERVTINGRQFIGGSFRGVQFFVESSDYSDGRRSETHEFSRRDETYTEDNGRRARTYSLSLYVIGSDSDYRQKRDALIDAFAAEGSGTLRHPFSGDMRAQVGSFSLRESLGDQSTGGLARFEVDFTRTAESPPLISGVTNPAASIKRNIASAVSAARDDMEAGYDVTGLASSQLTRIEGLVSDAGSASGEAFGPFTQTARDAASFRRRIDRLVNDAASLVTSPLSVFDAIRDSLAFAFRPPEMPAAFASLISAAPATVAGSPFLTADNIREAAAYETTRVAVNRLRILAAVESASRAKFNTEQHANEARDMMRDSIDGLIDEAESDDFYRAATDVKNDFRAMVPGTRRDIVMLRNYVPASTTNTLAISHALYGNVTREHDIEEINAIPDPCFVRGGIVLRVPHV